MSSHLLPKGTCPLKRCSKTEGLTTVNNADMEEGGKVNFKIAPVDNQKDHVLNVNSAWAVKDLTTPLKHTKLSRSVERCPHLRQVSFPEVERKKISILLGTNIQEVFIALDVRRGKPNDPIAIKSYLGWSILGGASDVQSRSQELINLVTVQDVSLGKQLEEFWKVEPYAEARLQYLKRRFHRDPELEVKYRAVIEDCVVKGYARRLSKEEAAAVSNITWYIPHHAVTNPNKPGKQLSHEFLWWPGSIEDRPEDYKMLVHIFRAKSSPCCANKALNKTAQDNEDNYLQEVVQTVRRNFYVDDVFKSVPRTQQAVRLTSDLTKLLKEGGFRLTKFASNSREVLQSIPPDLRANPLLDLNLDQLPLERALGVYWDAQSDTFKFQAVQAGKPSTKHGVLYVVSSVFDPLGFLSPFVFSAKILLQDLWRDKIPWDQEITEPYLSQWQRWMEELPHVITINIPRCYKSQFSINPSTIQLHNFPDASRCGYAAVSYLRFVDERGVTQCSFVMGKTRNAPIREWTIPRLELQAAVLATRLSKMIVNELDLQVDQIFFWSDSMTSLQYIKNETRRF
ncbi:uncharacterized protein LOC141891656 [Acropora palmata]|uniref:uncharacterized protein LOC141891656 n=1 Tax=Acropora palmata TaxID=6131 RepID=UPI003D9FC20F